MKDDDLVDAIVNNKKIEYTEENNFPVTQTMDEIEKKRRNWIFGNIFKITFERF